MELGRKKREDFESHNPDVFRDRRAGGQQDNFQVYRFEFKFRDHPQWDVRSGRDGLHFTAAYFCRRIPSDKGYRFYVDTMLGEREREVEELKGLLLEKDEKMDTLLKRVARVLATNTNYAAMITTPQYQRNSWNSSSFQK